MLGQRANRNRAVGQLGEDLACEALLARGYTIVERGWRCQAGELDIVAREGDCWAFVEVKARRGRGAGLPEDGITPAKRRRLLEAARTYLSVRDLGEVSWRIDVLALELDRAGRALEMRLVRAAVTE